MNPVFPYTQTLCSRKWLMENWTELFLATPITPTELNQTSTLTLLFRLKILGIDWRSVDEATSYLDLLTRVGLITLSEGGALWVGNPVRPTPLDKLPDWVTD